MKRKKRIIIVILVFLVSLIFGGLVFYNTGLSSVSNTSEKVVFKVESGKGKLEIIEDLKAANIIKNKISAIIYVGLYDLNLQAGEYTIDRSDNAKIILNQIANGKITEPEQISVTFVEGKRITDYAKVISENFGYNYEEIIAVFKDREYAKELIGKYSFLSEKILDSEIYYPLEGYLYPDTYSFYKEASIKNIIEKLVSQMGIKLNSLKANIEDKNLSVHELLTMSTIVEMEGTNASNRAKIAQVIYKRLDLNMSLGMDVTTYYAVQKEMKEPLTKKDLASTSKYNTRLLSYIGLPIGPICSPSLESITAVLNPSDTNYIFFYASKDGTIKFTDDYDEFLVFTREG